MTTLHKTEEKLLMNLSSWSVEWLLFIGSFGERLTLNIQSTVHQTGALFMAVKFTFKCALEQRNCQTLKTIHFPVVETILFVYIVHYFFLLCLHSANCIAQHSSLV